MLGPKEEEGEAQAESRQSEAVWHRLTPAELAAKKAKQAEEGENPAVTPKTTLSCIISASKE